MCGGDQGRLIIFAAALYEALGYSCRYKHWSSLYKHVGSPAAKSISIVNQAIKARS